MNKVINFCVDEDKIVSVEVIENVGDWKWLGYMVMGGMEVLYDVGMDKMVSVFEGMVEDEDDEVMEECKEKWKEFMKLVEMEGDDKMVVWGNWSVEYDWNIGVMVCDM